MPKKKVSRAIFRGGMAEAVALEDEQTDEQSTTTAPDGSQIPVAHATPVANSNHGSEHLISSSGVEPGLLLVGLGEHDDERSRLSQSLHQATLRVKETYARLKVGLEPLTFAYGEDEGHQYYEKIVNSPESYREDRRPAFEQVALAALAHDEAMHRAGLAQRELEDFDTRALPIDLLRQVINQRFRVLEDRVRFLERSFEQHKGAGLDAESASLRASSPPSHAQHAGTVSLGHGGGGGGGRDGEEGEDSPPSESSLMAGAPGGDTVIGDLRASGATAVATGGNGGGSCDGGGAGNSSSEQSEGNKGSGIPPAIGATSAASTVLESSGSSAAGPVLVQHWCCTRVRLFASEARLAPACFTIVVSPVFSEVQLHQDPEFNAILRRRANRAAATDFLRFLLQVLDQRAAAAAEEDSHSPLAEPTATGSRGERSATQIGDLSMFWAEGEVETLSQVVGNSLGTLADTGVESPKGVSDGFRVLLVTPQALRGLQTETGATSCDQSNFGEGLVERGGEEGRDTGFEPLFRVMEELSRAFYLRLHDAPSTSQSVALLPPEASPVKYLRIFR